MPTPAKLVCALMFCGLAWFTADTIVRLLMEEGFNAGRFREWVALAGLIIGWKTIGNRVSGPMNKGTTMPNAVTAGIAGAIVLTIGGLFMNGFVRMISESLDLEYTEVGQAAEAWMDFVWNDAILIAHPVVLGIMFGGAAVIGLVGGMVGRTLR